MATYTGQDGVISIGGAAVAEVRSFSVEYTREVIEDTTMGDAARTYKHGLKSFTGSADVYIDADGSDVNGITAALMGDDIGANSAVAVILYPAGDATGNAKLTGSVIITGVSINSTMDGIVEGTISFQGTGDLTFGVAA